MSDTAAAASPASPRCQPPPPPPPFLRAVPDPARQFSAAFGRLSFTGSSGFRYDKTLLSYVFTNPPADTVLNEHDLVYLLRPGGGGEGVGGGGDDM